VEMLRKEIIEHFRRTVQFNDCVYLTAREANRQGKNYMKILKIIGGAGKVQESIYSSDDMKNAATCAPYISKRQIKKLGRTFLSNRHHISINSYIILKHFIKKIKEYEKKSKYQINDKIYYYNFCKFIKDIIPEQSIIENLTPDIELKLVSIQNDMDMRDPKINEYIDLNLEKIELYRETKFNCEEREV
jgi:hypothetical protein